jgi:hypothetical protein
MTTEPAPMCYICKHYRVGLACDTFPDKILHDVVIGKSHEESNPGENGILFESISEYTLKKFKTTYRLVSWQVYYGA